MEARAYAAWVDAREKGDWASFAPVMEEARDRAHTAVLVLTDLYTKYIIYRVYNI